MNEMEKTQVYCAHFLYICDEKIIEMPPRMVKELKDAGVIITLDGKPEGEQIPMNWEPDTKHNAYAIPNTERKECPYFTQVTGR